MKKKYIFLYAIPLSILGLLTAFSIKKQAKSPNIIIILMDDLGYGDKIE